MQHVYQKILTIFFLALTLSAPFGEAAAAVEVQASLNTPGATVGQPVDLIIYVSKDPGDAVFPPAADEIVSPLQVRDIKLAPFAPEKRPSFVAQLKEKLTRRSQAPDVTKDSRFIYVISIVAWDTGEITIPEIKLKYLLADGTEGTAAANSLSLIVTSVLPTADAEILPKDIRGVVAAPFPYLTLATVLLALAALSGGIFYLARWSQKRAAVRIEELPPPPPRPAHEVAYERLDRIKAENFPGRGLLKEYYFQLSLCLREYLELKFEFAALERTTFEIARLIRNVKTPQAIKDAALSIMKECDAVKFAKAKPPLREAEQVWARVKEIVDRTRAEEPEPVITAAPDDNVEARTT